MTFTPGGLTTEVCDLEVQQAIVQRANPWDLVFFTTKGSPLASVKRGHVVSETNRSPARVAASFVGQVTVMAASTPIEPGAIFDVDIGSIKVTCRFDSFLKKVDRRSGKVGFRAAECEFSSPGWHLRTRHAVESAGFNQGPDQLAKRIKL